MLQQGKKRKENNEYCDYHRGDISGPHSEGVPVDIVQKVGAVLSQAVNELRGQRGGKLKELIRINERSHCSVQTKNKKSRGLELFIQFSVIYINNVV